MALDPTIALGVQIPTPQNPTTALANMESVAALRDQREALAEQRQQQAQKLIQDAKDKAATNAALQQSQGDLLGAGDLLTQSGNGILGQQLYQQHAAQTEKMAQALKAQHDVAQAHLDTALQIASTMGDSPEHYAAGRQAIKGLIGDDPQLGPWFQQFVPENPDPSQIPTIVSGLTKVGNDAKTNAANQQKDVEDFMAGKTSQATASRLLSLPPQMRPQALALAAQMSRSTEARTALLQQFAPIINDDAALKKAAMTVEQQVTAEEAAKRDAETHRHNVQDEANAAARIKLSGGTGAEPEAIAGWVRQLRDPQSGVTLTQVPTAIRTAVVSQLQPGEVTKLTAQDLAMMNLAKKTIPSIDRVEEMAKQIDAMGLMGTVGGRWRSLVSGESAATDISGLTPQQQQLVGQFVTEAGLLTSGIARVHGGARGGGSPQMQAILAPILEPNKSTLETYIGHLEGARDYMNTYASPPDRSSPTGVTPSPSSTNPMTPHATPVPKNPVKGQIWQSPTGPVTWNGLRWVSGG